MSMAPVLSTLLPIAFLLTLCMLLFWFEEQQD